MTSEKQIAANRFNAQKSIEPTTGEGKAIVARNVTRHGFVSKNAHSTILKL